MVTAFDQFGLRLSKLRTLFDQREGLATQEQLIENEQEIIETAHSLVIAYFGEPK